MQASRGITAIGGLALALAACAPSPASFPLAPLERAAQCVAELVVGHGPAVERTAWGSPAAGYWDCPDWALTRTRQAIDAAGIDLATYSDHVTVLDVPLSGVGGGQWLGPDLVIIDRVQMSAWYGVDATFYEAHEILGHPIAIRLGLTFNEG